MAGIADGVEAGAETTVATVADAADAEALFNHHFASFCRTAFLVVGDAALAEEVVMETFARALPRWAAVQRADQPVAYLRRAVVNLCVSRLRRLALERRVAARRAEREPVSWDTDSADAARPVIDAVRRLPARQRACVVLRYFDDLPEDEIAATLGCSVGTVKSQLSKARAHLAAWLGEPEEVRE